MHDVPFVAKDQRQGEKRVAVVVRHDELQAARRHPLRIASNCGGRGVHVRASIRAAPRPGPCETRIFL
jgi:hypothetical protein